MNMKLSVQDRFLKIEKQLDRLNITDCFQRAFCQLMSLGVLLDKREDCECFDVLSQRYYPDFGTIEHVL